MPQMAPTLWLVMLTTLFMVMILMNSFIYFSNKGSKLSTKKKYSYLESMTWSW